jgi:hypothetical protein
MDEQLAVTVLRETKEILDKHGISYWLDMGTLLGAVRDGKFIPWDEDVDLGTWYADITRNKLFSISRELQVKGFSTYVELPKHFHTMFFKKRGIEVMLKLYRPEGRRATSAYFVERTRVITRATLHLYALLALPWSQGEEDAVPTFIGRITRKIAQKVPLSLRRSLAQTGAEIYRIINFRRISIIVPSQYFTILHTTRFYGMEFKVPSETEEYLTYRYGKDWRIPKKDYLYYKEDGAIHC